MNKILEYLIISSFFFNLAAGLLGPIYAVYVEQIGGDLLTAGGAFASYTIMCGIAIFFLSRWENRSKHKETILVVSRALALIGFTGYLFVTNPAELFFVQIILGIALALAVPAFDTLYSINLDKGREAIEWGVWEGMYQITLGISALVGAAIASTFGFRTLFIVMMWFALFSFIAMLLMARKKNQHHTKPGKKMPLRRKRAKRKALMPSRF